MLGVPGAGNCFSEVDTEPLCIRIALAQRIAGTPQSAPEVEHVPRSQSDIAKSIDHARGNLAQNHVALCQSRGALLELLSNGSHARRQARR